MAGQARPVWHPFMSIAGGTVLVLVAATLAPVVALRWVRPPTSSFMLRHRLPLGSQKPACERIANRWVTWGEISPHVPIAVVAAEDQRFPEHAGFDFDSIADALRERSPRDRPRGASTITQQLAKNLFLWPGRSWFRKAVEAYFTALIELGWPKRRILEVYLNIAQFGPCTFGVAAASERFFGKPPSSLNPGEAALLAAVLPNPVRLRADRPSAYVENRATWVLEQVARLGGSGYLRDL